MANREAFFVVVGVDEPAGDAVGFVADDFPGLGLEDIHAVRLHVQLGILTRFRDLVRRLNYIDTTPMPATTDGKEFPAQAGNPL